jgi:hypothetical protein
MAAGIADSPVGQVGNYATLAQQLAAPEWKRRLQRQLNHLASSHWQQERLLSVEQLQYKCYLSITPIEARSQQPSWGRGHLSELEAAAASAAQAVCRLEPTNPQGHMRMANALLAGTLTQRRRQAAQCFLRILELGQQQCRTVHGAVQAIVLSPGAPLPAGGGAHHPSGSPCST